MPTCEAPLGRLEAPLEAPLQPFARGVAGAPLAKATEMLLDDVSRVISLFFATFAASAESTYRPPNMMQIPAAKSASW